MQGITQVIDAEKGTVQNIADFRIASLLDGSLNVEGTVAPAMAPGEAVRVDVKFTAFCLKIGALPQLKVPLGWSNPTVWATSPIKSCLWAWWPEAPWLLQYDMKRSAHACR